MSVTSSTQGSTPINKPRLSKLGMWGVNLSGAALILSLLSHLGISIFPRKPFFLNRTVIAGDADSALILSNMGEGGPNIALRDQSGTVRIMLSMNEDIGPSIDMFDEKGKRIWYVNHSTVGFLLMSERPAEGSPLAPKAAPYDPRYGNPNAPGARTGPDGEHGSPPQADPDEERRP